MSKCVECGTETQLYMNGVPVCPKCSEQRPDPLAAATERLNAARAAWRRAMGMDSGDDPAGPDGQLDAAAIEYKEAIHEFVERSKIQVK